MTSNRLSSSLERRIAFGRPSAIALWLAWALTSWHQLPPASVPGHSSAHLDPATGAFVEPAPAEVSRLAKGATDTSRLPPREALVEEAATSPAGGVRVRLGSRFHSALRGELAGDGVESACADADGVVPDRESAEEPPR
jgi:hypothetical protein